MTNTFTRCKTLTSYAAYSRFLSETSDEPVGYTPRAKDIPSPYASSPTDAVYDHPTYGKVMTREVRHRRFEAFKVTGPLFATHDEAADAFIASLR